MEFAQRHAITDICILCATSKRRSRFYRDKLGFALQHRAPGFADFTGAGHTLALWEREHIADHTGVPVDLDASASLAIAVKLPIAGEARRGLCGTLRKRASSFVRPPADYPWNARCVYFAGPDGEVWELYAWLPGGAPGKIVSWRSAR